VSKVRNPTAFVRVVVAAVLFGVALLASSAVASAQSPYSHTPTGGAGEAVSGSSGGQSGEVQGLELTRGDSVGNLPSVANQSAQVEAASQSRLALTGGDIASLVVLAVALLGAGTALVVIGRRRNAPHHA
jgi:hypothetical protein